MTGRVYRGVLALALLAFPIFQVGAQRVLPPAPPPESAKQDNGPSLEVTMKFIEDKLGSLGRVNYMAYLHDNKEGEHWTNDWSAEATNVRANAQACRIDYHWWVSREGQVQSDQDLWISLKAVQEVVVMSREEEQKELDTKAGHPEWTVRVDPPVFVIEVRQEKSERVFLSYDEVLANRIAKALVRAVELCGGGNKEPF